MLVGYKPSDVLGPHHTCAFGTTTVRTSGALSAAVRRTEETNNRAKPAGSEVYRMRVLHGRLLLDAQLSPFYSRRMPRPIMSSTFATVASLGALTGGSSRFHRL